MKQFCVVPKIIQMDTAEEFCSTYGIGSGDLLLVSGRMYEQHFKGLTDGACVINYRNYGAGEPTDLMVEGIWEDIKDVDYKRVIAVGGGTILDVAKLFALKNISPVVDLYDRKLEIKKEKELILVPTTCGTGSEVTNISILELTAKNTKMGLADPELYADDAVLIPELLYDLPFKFFATSSIDALIHSIESYTSPKANDFTRIFSLRAMTIILNAYKEITEKGREVLKPLLKDLLTASTFAGIAFGNAGCAAVHAMSYPLGAACHVPHGEANYVMFTAVYKTYMKLQPEGSITALNRHLAGILECGEAEVYDRLEVLLDQLISRKALHEYGVREEDLDTYTETVMTKQGRLMANNYTELDAETVKAIYISLF